MNIFKKIAIECVAVPLVFKGVPHQIGRSWFWKMENDKRLGWQGYSFRTRYYWCKHGYLSSSIQRWGLDGKCRTDYISDFEYCCLSPINSSFSKWLTDMLTTQRVMRSADEHFRNVYFSIIKREGKQLILRVGQEDREYTLSDVLDLLKEKGQLELRPAWWNSKGERYLFAYKSDIAGTKCIFCNGQKVNENSLGYIISEITSNYVIADAVSASYSFGDRQLEHELKLWVSNDYSENPRIMAAEIHIFTNNNETDEINEHVEPVESETGSFIYQGENIYIPCWKRVKQDICNDALDIPQIALYTTSIALSGSGNYTYLCFSGWPKLPEGRFSDEFNSYLKEKYATQFHKKSLVEQMKALCRKVRTIERRTVGRKGMRPYMYGLWRSSARSDLLHTKGVSLPQKLWAHRHGFFSWRLYQYGLTKENYTQFLSDYDYYWLNRINNHYQIWVNDKTTFRYVMEPFKQFVPQYFFSVYKRSGKTLISKMWDCPSDVADGFDGVLEMLKRKGKLAFKASAGTHGDGFFCLAHENGIYYANGEIIEKDDLQRLIEGTEVFYVITEYLEMHHDIKRIYDKSVNTVRMMVVNDHGYDPRILQTYMRIGAGNSGYTDNVGYGGICVFVDKETGELYKPETIKDHVFYDCPVHPDSGVAIAGKLPNWDLVKRKILEICRYLCELEYLGFDIAITANGFQILEINIHQDLHKVASFDYEIKEYFNRKISYKYETLKKRTISSEDGRDERGWLIS